MKLFYELEFHKMLQSKFEGKNIYSPKGDFIKKSLLTKQINSRRVAVINFHKDVLQIKENTSSFFTSTIFGIEHITKEHLNMDMCIFPLETRNVYTSLCT